MRARDDLSESRSEDKLSPKLNGSRIAHRCHRSVGSESDVGADRAEVSEVKNVECFSAQLQASLLTKSDVLGHGEVEALSCGTVDYSATS